MIKTRIAMKKIAVLLAALLSLAPMASAGAQEAVIAADTTSHDFGDISEQGGDVSYTFTVRNAGDAPMIITRVVASCGCTTPEWSQEPIAPGGEGNIKVTYSPLNRVGAFHKTVSVYSNGSSGVFYLTITGNVTP